MLSPAVTRIGRSFLFGVLTLLILYLVYLGGGWAGIHAAELRQTSLLFAALAVGTWAAIALVQPSWRPHTRLWPAFPAALVAFALATLTSRVPRMSLEYLLWAIVLTALYLLLVALLRHGWFRDRIGALVVGLCVLTGAWYVLAVGGLWVEWWRLVGRVTAPPFRPLFESLTFGNPSAVMTVGLLFLATAVGWLGLSTLRRRVIAGTLAALTAFSIVVSGSRAGWVALAVAVGVTGVAWLALPANRAAVRQAVRRAPRWWPALLLPVAALAVIAAPGIASRLNAGGEAMRTTYYAIALRLWGESPVLGTGPGSWVAQRIEYTQAGEPDFYIPHAHNVYLQTLAETGLLGVAAGVVVAVALLLLVRDAIRDDRPERRRMGWAALFAIAYFAAHHLFDFYPSMPTALFAFAIPIAWLDATSERPLVRINVPRRVLMPATLAGAAGLVVAFGWLLRSESIAVRVSDGVIAANRGDWTRAATTLAAASSEDPDIPAYRLSLGLALAHTGDHAGAAQAFRAAATVDALPESWLNLAAEEALLGRTAEARAALDEALRLGIQRPGIALAGGDLALRLGATELAARAFREAIRLAPSLAGDPWWSESAERAAVRDRAVASLVPTFSPDNAVLLLLQTGRTADAEAIVRGLAGSDGLPALILNAWAGDPAATQELEGRAAARPVDGPAPLVGLILGHRGEPEAERFKRWSSIRYAGTDPSAYEMRVIPLGEDTSGATSLASFYGHYTYRRPTPWDLLVPSLVHVELR